MGLARSLRIDLFPLEGLDRSREANQDSGIV